MGRRYFSNEEKGDARTMARHLRYMSFAPGELEARLQGPGSQRVHLYLFSRW